MRKFSVNYYTLYTAIKKKKQLKKQMRSKKFFGNKAY